MRINRPGGPSGIQKSKGAAKNKAKPVASGASGDSVQVADSASLRHKASVMLAEMPTVRLDRIEEIRDAIDRGAFKSDSRKVAVQIVCNALAERSWT
jgi:flagellar biosynthesis anti-sigma factor FlgM